MMTIAQTHPETTHSWERVLAMTFAVLLAAVMVGLFGGLPLFLGLMAWLAGPEVIRDLPYNYDGLPAEAQALLTGDGLFLCATLFMVPAGVVLLWLAVPRPGSIREYLGLKWPRLRQGLAWALILLAVYGYQLLDSWLGMPPGEEDIPRFLPLVLAVAVLTPIFEELLFRGFLVEGLRRSRVGKVGSVMLSTAVWTLVYSGTPMGPSVRFLEGSLLALARVRTGSTYLTVLVRVCYAVAVFAIANA